MKLILYKPKKALKPLLKQKPLRREMDNFKSNLIALLGKIDIIEKQTKLGTTKNEELPIKRQATLGLALMWLNGKSLNVCTTLSKHNAQQMHKQIANASC